jgi:lipoprotein-releasing system permease protein
MVGILKAIGTTELEIQKIFLYHAAIITILGIGLGLIAGLGLSYLQQYTHFIHLDESSYYISYAPVKVIGWQIALVCFCTGIICFLSLIIPSSIIRRLSPIKAIRFS